MQKKRVLKRILKHPFAVKLMALLLAGYLRFTYATTSWSYQGEHEEFYKLADENKSLISLFWHGRLAMTAFFRPKHMQSYALISKHADGAFLADVLRVFNIRAVSGSTSKGGATALLEAIKVMKQGGLLAVTPDGPRGPREKLSGHVISIAAKSGAYICPISYDCTRKKIFNSWDRFMLPLPFGRGVVYFGEPFLCVDGEEHAAKLRAQHALEDAVIQSARFLAQLSKK